MKTPYAALLWTVASSLWFVSSLTAQERGATPPRGRVLILDNERVLEGDVELVGSQYRLRRPLGETWVPADRVLSVCPDLQGAYQFLLQRINREDPDERLRLARWCHAQGLHDRALENARVAVQLRPGQAEGRRLLATLERTATGAGAPLPATKPKTPPGPPTPVAEVNSESLSTFATKVQPILMNACANCHASGRGGAFTLTRPSTNTTASSRSVQQNLAAVLAQVNRNQPQTSPLLTKAVTAHGDVARAPLAAKQLVAYRTLEEWVEKTLSGNPHLREVTTTTPPTTPPPVEPAPVVASPPAKPANMGNTGSGKFATEGAKPTTPVTPTDPFDPALFNNVKKG